MKIYLIIGLVVGAITLIWLFENNGLEAFNEFNQKFNDVIYDGNLTRIGEIVLKAIEYTSILMTFMGFIVFWPLYLVTIILCKFGLLTENEDEIEDKIDSDLEALIQMEEYLKELKSED